MRTVCYAVPHCTLTCCRVSSGGGEHIHKGILRFEASPAVRDGQEMEIVVAQDRYGTVPQCLDKSEYLQRLRATVHQITGKPEPVSWNPDFNGEPP